MPKAKPKIVAIVQARMGSTRLPGKVLMKIEGKPMVQRVVERLKKAKRLNEIVLAIPDTKENDALEEFAKTNNIIYVRGSESDVLGRYYKAAKQEEADVVVRITADCPLVDPEIVDLIIDEHLAFPPVDYTSNVIERAFSRGLDVEVFNFLSLEQAQKQAKKPRQREHVTLYFLENPGLFSLRNELGGLEWKRPEFRLTVDTEEDLEFVRAIYKHFSPETDFSTIDVINFLDQNPKLSITNTKIEQKEFVSLRAAEKGDVKFLFNLRNKKYVYKNSRAARPVEWNEHISWADPVIEGKTDKELFIVEYEGKLAGQLRLDYDGDEAEVSISLLKEFHGKGVATRVLLILLLRVKREDKAAVLSAEVNKNNFASQKLFEKVGFKSKGEEGEWLKYSLPLKCNEGNKNS